MNLQPDESVDLQERLLNLVSLLYKSRRPVPAREILATVEGYEVDEDEGNDSATVERRFHHDLTRLAELGVMVRRVNDGLGEAGYAIDTTTSLLPPIDLTAEERLILETLARSYADRGEGEFSRALHSALLKLSFDNFSSQPTTEPVEATGPTALAVRRGRGRPKSVPATSDPAPALVGSVGGAEDRGLDVLMDAVLNRKTVSFRYQRPDGEAAEARRVDPWGIAFVRGSWYLAGFSHEREQERMFRLSRIEGRPQREHETTTPDFAPPADFRLESMVSRLMAPRDDSQRFEEVRLRITPDISFMVAEWASDRPDGMALVEQADDGTPHLRLRAPLERNVWRLMADYAPLANVEHPPELRDAFRNRLTRLRDLYATAANCAEPDESDDESES